MVFDHFAFLLFVFLGLTHQRAEDILMVCLPAWLSYRVIIYLLDDREDYSSELTTGSEESNSSPSLQTTVSVSTGSFTILYLVLP